MNKGHLSRQFRLALVGCLSVSCAAWALREANGQGQRHGVVLAPLYGVCRGKSIHRHHVFDFKGWRAFQDYFCSDDHGKLIYWSRVS